MNPNRTHNVSKVRREWTETPTKRKNESPERDFRDSLRGIAPLYGCALIAIPDTIPIKGRKIITHKKPCDDILITTHGNYLIEAKYGNNPLLPHQLDTQSKVNAMNSCVFQVHHRDPLKKEFVVNTRTLINYSWKKILNEIKKCELLCANCHFINHNKEY